jgi:hypothetical protein
MPYLDTQQTAERAIEVVGTLDSLDPFQKSEVLFIAVKLVEVEMNRAARPCAPLEHPAAEAHMTDDPIEAAERLAFQEWFEADRMPRETDWFRLDADGDYHAPASWAWHGWQARSAIQPVGAKNAHTGDPIEVTTLAAEAEEVGMAHPNVHTWPRLAIRAAVAHAVQAERNRPPPGWAGPYTNGSTPTPYPNTIECAVLDPPRLERRPYAMPIAAPPPRPLAADDPATRVV